MDIKISLEAARVNAKLSQKEVADKLKVSNKTVFNWENGKTFPSADKIDALCELYGIPYDNINFLPNDSLKENMEEV
jgi:transcriptional regulator with XRE-family HTH domain